MCSWLVLLVVLSMDTRSGCAKQANKKTEKEKRPLSYLEAASILACTFFLSCR